MMVVKLDHTIFYENNDDEFMKLDIEIIMVMDQRC